MAKQSEAKKIDPFKTKKTKAPPSKAADAVTPPDEIAKAIDSFREAQDQYKHFEGEMTIHKDQILNFAHGEYAKRLLGGLDGSFKVMGEETTVTYVAMDASSGLTEEDLSEFGGRWGEEAADALITRDFSSIKFDASVLEANYDAVVEALQVLPESILQNLFKPMAMKARPGAADIAKRYAKTSEDMKDLLKQLKIKNYIR